MARHRLLSVLRVRLRRRIPRRLDIILELKSGKGVVYRPKRHHLPHHLFTGDAGQPQIAMSDLDDLQVGAAEPGNRDPQKYLTRSRLGKRTAFKLKRADLTHRDRLHGGG